MARLRRSPGGKTGLSLIAAAGLGSGILAGLAAGWATVGAMDPVADSATVARPWQQGATPPPAYTAGQGGFTFAAGPPIYATSPPPALAADPLTGAYARWTRDDAAEARQLDAKLDAEIRRIERQAQASAAQIQRDYEQPWPNPRQDAAPAAITPASAPEPQRGQADEPAPPAEAADTET